MPKLLVMVKPKFDLKTITGLLELYNISDGLMFLALVFKN